MLIFRILEMTTYNNGEIFGPLELACTANYKIKYNIAAERIFLIKEIVLTHSLVQCIV